MHRLMAGTILEHELSEVRLLVERQTGVLKSGGRVVQETRGWVEARGITVSQRSKEQAHDYRYFPEPDLVPLLVSREMREAARGALPAELPTERAVRFERELGLSSARARELAFRADLAAYFEATVAAGGNGASRAVEVANWIPLLVSRIGSETDPASSRVTPQSLAELVAMVSERKVSRDAAREVLDQLVASGGQPGTIVEERGLGALSDGLEEAVDRAIGGDPAAAEQVRAGNMKALGPLVGQVMRETKGRADGQEVRRLILKRLS